MKKNEELVLFNSTDGKVSLPVTIKNDSVWLTLDQVAELFGRDKSTVSRHIHNVFRENELDRSSTVAKNATVQFEGSREIERMIDYYNLDVIISVGYRVKSQRGVEFRKWANSVLKDYILQGYAVNELRMKQLGSTVKLLKRVKNDLDAEQVLSVIERYSSALDLLDDYDHQTLKRPAGQGATYVLTYEECRTLLIVCVSGMNRRSLEKKRTILSPLALASEIRL